jgi:hypothetical protein
VTPLVLVKFAENRALVKKIKHQSGFVFFQKLRRDANAKAPKPSSKSV